MAGIQDQIRIIFGYFCACLDRVNFVLKPALFPDNLDFVTLFELGEAVEGIELAKTARPVQIAPAVGGDDNWLVVD